MSHGLHLVYSLPFTLGLLFGIAGYLLYAWETTRYLNKHHPKADGTKHRIGGFNTTYAAAAVTLAIFGYVLMSAQDTHDQTVALAKNVAHCQAQFNEALINRAAINTEDTNLANQQSELRGRMDDARVNFLNQILNPPANVADLNRADPVRDQYVMDAVREYATWTGKITDQLKAVADQRKQVQVERDSKHPLPQNDCGGGE